jgi:hypothetical protein
MPSEAINTTLLQVSVHYAKSSEYKKHYEKPRQIARPSAYAIWECFGCKCDQVDNDPSRSSANRPRGKAVLDKKWHQNHLLDLYLKQLKLSQGVI